MDAVKTPANGKYVCVFSVSDQWEKSEHCFFCDRDWLRAGTLPSVPCLIYMHRWHGISIVTAKKKKLRELTGDIWQLILRAQLQSFACILLYSGAFSSHSPALCSARHSGPIFKLSACLELEIGVCVCVCVSVDVCVCERVKKQTSSALMRTGTETARILSAALPAGWRNVNKLSIFWLNRRAGDLEAVPSRRQRNRLDLSCRTRLQFMQTAHCFQWTTVHFSLEPPSHVSNVVVET